MRKGWVCAALLALLVVLQGSGAWGGVTVEGAAGGIAPVSSLSYDSGANRFLLNGSETVNNPVSREELLDLVNAIRLDDRVGVSVKLDNELIVYGKLNKRSQAAKKMENADNFFRAVVFAEKSLLRGTALPGNYEPKPAKNRERASVIYLGLDSFVFTKTGTTYYPGGVNASILLIPMAKYTAPDGGYLPDYDALEKDEFQKEDKENTDHINQHKQEYLALDVIRNAIHVGEAASLVRFFRSCGINLETLAESIEKGDGRTLQGNLAQVAAIQAMQNAAAQPPVAPSPAAPAPVVAAPAPSPAATTTDTPEEQKIAAPALAPIIQTSQPLTAEKKEAYAAAIRSVFEQDAKFGGAERIKLTRSTVNDGSYVRFRRDYLRNISMIDLADVPSGFATAFRAHQAAWQKTLDWLEKQKIEEGQEAFTSFGEAHAPYRKELRDSYLECKKIAEELGVKAE